MALPVIFGFTPPSPWRTTRWKDGRSRLLLPFKPEICNRKGDIHGGASAALVDLAMSLAIRSQTDGVAGLSTISMTINYLDPGQGALTATGKVTKFGRTIAIAEAQVHAEDGSLVVQASGAFRLIWPKPAG